MAGRLDRSGFGEAAQAEFGGDVCVRRWELPARPSTEEMLTIDRPHLSYGTFELCAPGNFDSYQTADILSDVIGRPITASQLPADEFTARMPEGSFRDGMTRMLAHYDRHGLPAGNALVLRTILGREPRTLKEFFRELATG